MYKYLYERDLKSYFNAYQYSTSTSTAIVTDKYSAKLVAKFQTQKYKTSMRLLETTYLQVSSDLVFNSDRIIL